MEPHLLAQLDRIEDLARSKDIPTVRILPFFLQSGFTKEDLYLLPGDGHANKNGYRLQAAALLPSLEAAVLAVMRGPVDAGRSFMELANSART